VQGTQGPTGPAGITGATGPTGQTGPTGLSSFTFNVAFSGDAPGSVSGLPTGWSAAISANDVTITHNVGQQIGNVVYWGYTAGTFLWHARYPTASNELTMQESTKTTQFKLRVTSVVAGADSGGTARVVCFF
jgi:hypothetical protein